MFSTSCARGHDIASSLKAGAVAEGHQVLLVGFRSVCEDLRNLHKDVREVLEARSPEVHWYTGFMQILRCTEVPGKPRAFRPRPCRPM